MYKYPTHVSKYEKLTAKETHTLIIIIIYSMCWFDRDDGNHGHIGKTTAEKINNNHMETGMTYASRTG